MNKRVTLEAQEIITIVTLLERAQAETTLEYEVVLAGKRYLQRIIDKLQRPIKKEADE